MARWTTGDKGSASASQNTFWQLGELIRCWCQSLWACDANGFITHERLGTTVGERLSTFSVQVITLTWRLKIKPSQLWGEKQPQKLFLWSLTPSSRCERQEKKKPQAQSRCSYLQMYSSCSQYQEHWERIIKLTGFLFQPGSLYMYFQEEMN